MRSRKENAFISIHSFKPQEMFSQANISSKRMKFSELNTDESEFLVNPFPDGCLSILSFFVLCTYYCNYNRLSLVIFYQICSLMLIQIDSLYYPLPSAPLVSNLNILAYHKVTLFFDKNIFYQLVLIEQQIFFMSKILITILLPPIRTRR